MARFLRRATALSSLALFVGCGGAKLPAKAPVHVSRVSAKQAKKTAPLPDPIPLIPVAAPKDLFLLGRFKDLDDAVDTISNWAGMPKDWRRMIAQQEPAVSHIVAVDAPVDVAAALDPKDAGDLSYFAVVSVGLNSLDDAVAFARRRGEDVHETSPGVYRVGDGGDHTCTVAASVGKVPARLVCGDSRQDVDALLPYVTRGMPKLDLGHRDLHLELRAEPFRRRYARRLREIMTRVVPYVLKRLSLGTPAFDNALASAVHGLDDEFITLVDDLDAIDIDATIDKRKAEIAATGAIKFHADSSWTVHTLLQTEKHAGLPPDMFWKLPEDAGSAAYGVSPRRKRFQEIARTVEELVNGLMSRGKVPRRVRRETVDAISQLFTLDGTHVVAHGAVPAPQAKGSLNRQRNGFIADLGWNVVGFDAKPARLKKLLSTAAKVYNNPQLRRVLHKKLGKYNKNPEPILLIAMMAYRLSWNVAAALMAPLSRLPRLGIHAARVRGLAPGSTAYEIKLPGKLFVNHNPFQSSTKKKAKPKTPKPVTLTMVLMPDKDQTWLGYSANAKELYKRLAQIHQGKNTLASRAGLAQLKHTKVILGGFVSLAQFTNSIRADYGADPGSRFTKSLEKVFNALPNHGETPIPYAFVVRKDGGTSLDWSIHTSKAVVADIGAAVSGLTALENSSR